MKQDFQSGTLEYPKFLKVQQIALKPDIEGEGYVLIKARINIMHISCYGEFPETEVDGTMYQATAIHCGGIKIVVTVPIDIIDKMIENTEIKFKDTSTADMTL